MNQVTAEHSLLRTRSGPAGRGPKPSRRDDELTRRYHLTRLLIAVVVVLVSLALVVVWKWPPGLLVTFVAAGAAGDAWMRYVGRWLRQPLLPLLVDSTAVGLATVFGQLPAEIGIAPFAYLAVSAFTLLRTRLAAVYVLYPAAWLVVHLLMAEPGRWEGSQLIVLRATILLTYLPGLIAILVATSVALGAAGALNRQLDSKRRQLDLAITSAPLILFEYDRDGVFTVSEGAGLAKLALVPGEVVGRSVLDVYRDAPQVLAGVARSLRGESFSDVVQFGELFFQVFYAAQLDDDGAVDRVTGVATDVSERVAAEDELANLVRSKDEFVATVAHELRTPLTAVVGLSEELRTSSASFSITETEEFIQMIADQSREVAAIVEDLLVVARQDIGKVTVVSDRVDLRRAVETVLTETEHLRTPSTRAISVFGDGVYAEADPHRVRQILRNLVSNAYRYGGEQIWIELNGDSASSRVVVADSGPGIHDNDREAIFRPFQRAHDTPGRPGSLGLGLSVSRNLADVMQGSLTYRYAGGRSRFELSLPPSRRTVEQAAQPPG